MSQRFCFFLLPASTLLSDHRSFSITLPFCRLALRSFDVFWPFVSSFRRLPDERPGLSTTLVCYSCVLFFLPLLPPLWCFTLHRAPSSEAFALFVLRANCAVSMRRSIVFVVHRATTEHSFTVWMELPTASKQPPPPSSSSIPGTRWRSFFFFFLSFFLSSRGLWRWPGDCPFVRFDLRCLRTSSRSTTR